MSESRTRKNRIGKMQNIQCLMDWLETIPKPKPKKEDEEKVKGFSDFAKIKA